MGRSDPRFRNPPALGTGFCLRARAVGRSRRASVNSSAGDDRPGIPRRWHYPGRTCCPPRCRCPPRRMIDVPRETQALLERYVDLLLVENDHQNLIGKSTVAEIWDRHVADSAQLVRFAPRPDSSWLDIGSGAGLPGMVIAI